MACIQDIEYLARPAAILSNHDIELAEKHTEVLKDFLENAADQFVSEHRSEALLEQFLSDGTPLSTTERVRCNWDKFRVTRSAKSCKEYLVQRLFLTVSSAVMTLLADVRPMFDKTGLTSYNGIVSLWAGARQLGHTGFLLSHSCFDRAVVSVMHRRIKQRAAAYDLHLVYSNPDMAEWLILTNWTTIVGCAAHDFHNALKWSVLLYFGCKQTMRDSWVILQSLRHSFDQLAKSLPSFMATHLAFENWQLLEGMVDFIRHRWRAL